MSKIYLDHNATTPVDEQVLEKMLPYFSEKFGNAASSTHSFGWLAEDAVDTARKQVAQALNVIDQQITFTSGSTEAINMAIKGVWELYSPRKGKHIITCQTEHKATLDVCAYLEKKGADVTYLPVNAAGQINLDELREAITDQTILVSLMMANNETGVIFPMAEIATIVHEKGSMLMSDCTQAVGKLNVDAQALGIDILCCSAHKFYGPKGIGAIYLRRKKPRVALTPLIHGGGHQRGVRSGTLNVPAIVGMGTAIQLAIENVDPYQKNVGELRDYLEAQLSAHFDILINGSNSPRLANTSNISFKGKSASRILEAVKGSIAVSTGSACTSAVMEPSHVLKAMGLSDEDGYASIRFSLGKNSTKQEIDKTIELLKTRIL